MYDAAGFSMTTPFYAQDTGLEYNMAGFNSTGYHQNGTLYDDNGLDRDGDSEPEEEVMYDAAGFSMTTPFYAQDTGLEYNMAGFNSTGYHQNGTLYDDNGLDRDGDSEPEEEVMYDAAGFSMTTPFYAQDTGLEYNMAGFNSTGYHQNGTLYDDNGLDRDGDSEPEEEVMYDAAGFSTTTPFYAQDTGLEYNMAGFNSTDYHQNGTLYDDGGYNSAGYDDTGWNAAQEYDQYYDEGYNSSPS